MKPPLATQSSASRQAAAAAGAWLPAPLFSPSPYTGAAPTTRPASPPRPSPAALPPAARPPSRPPTGLQKLSLFSCACAVVAGPIILGLDASTTLTAKLSICGTLASFGIFTTGLVSPHPVQWLLAADGGRGGQAGLTVTMQAAGLCASRPAAGSSSARRTAQPLRQPSLLSFLPPLQLTWFTQPYVQRLRYERGSDTVEVTTLSLLAQPRTDRFHVSEAGEADSVHPLTSFQARGRRYYLDAEHFPDKALMARLVPQAAAAHAMEAASAGMGQPQPPQPPQQPPGDGQQAGSQ